MAGGYVAKIGKATSGQATQAKQVIVADRHRRKLAAAVTKIARAQRRYSADVFPGHERNDTYRDENSTSDRHEPRDTFASIPRMRHERDAVSAGE